MTPLRREPYLSAALGEVSISVGRTQSFLGARYRRLAKRMPKKKALVATGNSVLTIMHVLLADPGARYTTWAPTTTNSACTSAARPATMSAAWNASAARSLSRHPPPAQATSP